MSRLGAALPMPSFASSMGGGPVGTMGAAAGHPPPGALPGGYQNPFLASALGAAPSAAQLTGGPQFTPIPMPPAFATSPYEQFQHQPEVSLTMSYCLDSFLSIIFFQWKISKTVSI